MADRRLLVWAFAAFHAAGFTLGFVLPAYVSGGLSDVLPEFGTILGFVGYGYLWLLSFLATRWALTGDVLESTVDGAVQPAVLRGSAAGGLVGLGLFLGPVLLLTVPGLATGGGDLATVAVVLAFGSGIGVAVGVVLGLVFTLLDVAALRLAGPVVGGEDPPTSVDPGPSARDADPAAGESEPVGDDP